MDLLKPAMDVCSGSIDADPVSEIFPVLKRLGHNAAKCLMNRDQ
jgi:hypothetical protein